MFTSWYDIADFGKLCVLTVVINQLKIVKHFYDSVGKIKHKTNYQVIMQTVICELISSETVITIYSILRKTFYFCTSRLSTFSVCALLVVFIILLFYMGWNYQIFLYNDGWLLLNQKNIFLTYVELFLSIDWSYSRITFFTIIIKGCLRDFSWCYSYINIKKFYNLIRFNNIILGNNVRGNI